MCERTALALCWLSVGVWTATAGPPGFGARFEQIKAAATRDELYRLLWALPKGGDLHHHFEYSVPVEDWFGLAAAKPYYTRIHLSECGSQDPNPLQYRTVRQSTYRRLPQCVQKDYRPLAALTPAQRSEWISALTLDRRGEGRDEFFERCVARFGDLDDDPELMPELLVRLLRRAAAENLLYLETQADARSFVDAEGTALTWRDAADRFRRRLAAPDARATGVEVRLQTAVLRFGPDAEQKLGSAFEFVHQNRDLWVGVNMVGREDNPAGKPSRFLETLRNLRRRYFDIRLSIHAGESEFPGRQVRDTLLLGADRIGHGTNLISDPDTLLLMRGNRFLVEVSLVSNHLLGYAPDISRHPFPEYLRLGIPVCLNTDDAGIFDSNITDEYFLAVTHFNLSWSEVVQIGRYSLVHSFAEPELKRVLVRRYDAAVAAFAKQYDRADWREALGTGHVQRSGYSRRWLGL